VRSGVQLTKNVTDCSLYSIQQYRNEVELAQITFKMSDSTSLSRMSRFSVSWVTGNSTNTNDRCRQKSCGNLNRQTRVRTNIQMLFSRTCKDQIPGFSMTRKSFFSKTFQKTFHSKHWLHEVKKCIYKIGYRWICIKVKKRKCQYRVIVISLTQEVALF